MSWEDLLNQKKEFETDELRDVLFTLVESEDNESLEKACFEFRSVILENFHLWRSVPSHLRSDATAVSLYANALITIANVFEENGNSMLLDLLEGKEDSNNPIVQWENVFEKADACKQAGQYANAIDILERLVSDMQNSKGTAAQNYLPMIYGALGENYFRSNKYDLAYDLTHLALEKCQKLGDVQGVISYSGNLSEVCKKQNKTNEAINWIIIATNIMIQIGEKEEAVQLRKHCNIEPTDELITLGSVKE